MSTTIKAFEHWLDAHPKVKEWAWFVALWCAGLATAMALSYPIKWLIKQLQ